MDSDYNQLIIINILINTFHIMSFFIYSIMNRNKIIKKVCKKCINNDIISLKNIEKPVNEEMKNSIKLDRIEIRFPNVEEL